MRPHELAAYLDALVANELMLSTMSWGPPGIGKSSIVAQTATRFGLDFIDVRLSQLAPTDLRGLPVPENGISRWYPPEFLPHDGRGVLFLDELNMAPPAIQRGLHEQIIAFLSFRTAPLHRLDPQQPAWPSPHRRQAARGAGAALAQRLPAGQRPRPLRGARRPAGGIRARAGAAQPRLHRLAGAPVALPGADA